MRMIKVLLVSNDGSGFANNVDVEPGTTVGQLFSTQKPDVDPGTFTLRVNRDDVGLDYTLQAGDKVTMTPSNIEGA